MRGQNEMHHVNWTRRAWQQHPDFAIKQLRRHSALIVPIPHYNHRLLHYDMPPTPFPTHDVAANLLEELGRADQVRDRVAAFTHAAHFLLSEAMSPDLHYAESANHLGNHYSVQLEYLMMEEELAAAALRATCLRAA